jgi:hypothetical protein
MDTALAAPPSSIPTGLPPTKAADTPERTRIDRTPRAAASRLSHGAAPCA